MNARSQQMTRSGKGWEKGTRLYCSICGSEIEILNPSASRAPDQVFRCCGRDMQPTTEVCVHFDSEA
jgi:hypothetical protein